MQRRGADGGRGGAVCGPRGTSVVVSLVRAAQGIGMRYHVQLRRTMLFGAAPL